MDDYDVNIRADVVGNLVTVGTQLNVHDLSKERHFLRFRNAVTIKVRTVVPSFSIPSILRFSSRMLLRHALIPSVSDKFGLRYGAVCGN
jgi:hypothetical protein